MGDIRVQLTDPAYPPPDVKGDKVTVCINKIGVNRYSVDPFLVKNRTKVEWVPANFETNKIVVFFPTHDTPLPAPAVVVEGPPGIYHYALFVRVNGHFFGVEGNSPPEMVIE
jgi:hypothetical protein